MAKKGNDIIQQLKLELGLDTSPATQAHNKATTKILAEVNQMIDKYHKLGEAIKSALTPTQEVKRATKENAPGYAFWDIEKQGYSYMGKTLKNKTEAGRQREAERIRREAFRDKQEAFNAAKGMIPKVETALDKEKFYNIVNSMKEKYYAFGKVANITSHQVNRAIVEAGFAAKMSAEEIRKMLVPGDTWLTQMHKIAQRALLTVPVWMALRNSIQLVVESLKMGTQAIIKYDKELARIKNITDDVENVDEFMKNLGEKARKMSSETGKSIDEILHSFYGFKDAGLSSEVAMAGMETSVKGSIALFGDLKETAKTLTDIYVVMGDKIRNATTPQEKMEKIMSAIVVLQKTNKFELNEYIEGLKTFAGTAAANNLTLDQMTFMLAKAHTFMQRGSAGGTQLANAFRFLAKNSAQVGYLLGETIQVDDFNKFEVMIKVLDRLYKKFQAGKDVQNWIREIFGQRAEKVTAPMIANLRTIMVEWDKFTKMTQEDRSKEMTKQYENAITTLQTQFERLNRIREQMAMQFIAGFLGIDISKTKDAAEQLKKINDTLEKMIDNFKGVGAAAKTLGVILTGVFAVNLLAKFLESLITIQAVFASIRAEAVATKTAVASMDAAAATGAVAKKLTSIPPATAATLAGAITVFLTGIITQSLIEVAKSVSAYFVETGKRKANVQKDILDKIQSNQMTPEQARALAQDIKKYRGSYYLDKKTANELVKLLEIVAEGKMPKFPEGTVKAIQGEKKPEKPEEEGTLPGTKEDEDDRIQRLETFYDFQSTMLEKQRIFGASQLDIEKARLMLMNQSSDLLKKDEKMHKQLLTILKLETAEIIKFSDTLGGSIKTGIEGILAGTGNLKDLLTGFNKTVQDTFRGSIAQGLTDTLMESGIGQMFGEMNISLREFFTGNKAAGISDRLKDEFADGGETIKGSFDYGADITYKSIIKGFQEGLSLTNMVEAGGLKNIFNQNKEEITAKTSPIIEPPTKIENIQPINIEKVVNSLDSSSEKFSKSLEETFEYGTSLNYKKAIETTNTSSKILEGVFDRNFNKNIDKLMASELEIQNISKENQIDSSENINKLDNSFKAGFSNGADETYQAIIKGFQDGNAIKEEPTEEHFIPDDLIRKINSGVHSFLGNYFERPEKTPIEETKVDLEKPIKGSFEYGTSLTYQNIVKGFQDGTKVVTDETEKQVSKIPSILEGGFDKKLTEDINDMLNLGKGTNFDRIPEQIEVEDIPKTITVTGTKDITYSLTKGIQDSSNLIYQNIVDGFKDSSQEISSKSKIETPIKKSEKIEISGEDKINKVLNSNSDTISKNLAKAFEYGTSLTYKRNIESIEEGKRSIESSSGILEKAFDKSINSNIDKLMASETEIKIINKDHQNDIETNINKLDSSISTGFGTGASETYQAIIKGFQDGIKIKTEETKPKEESIIPESTATTINSKINSFLDKYFGKKDEIDTDKLTKLTSLENNLEKTNLEFDVTGEDNISTAFKEGTSLHYQTIIKGLADGSEIAKTKGKEQATEMSSILEGAFDRNFNKNIDNLLNVGKGTNFERKIEVEDFPETIPVTETENINYALIQGSQEGGNLIYQSIIKGFQDSSQLISSAISETTPSEGTKEGLAGLLDKAVSGDIDNILAGKPLGDLQLGSLQKSQGNWLKDLGTSLFGEGKKGSNILGVGIGGWSKGGAGKGNIWQKAGAIGGAAMAVGGFGMDLAQSYKLKGTGNVFGGAMNLGMSGAMAGMAVGGPIGAVIGGAIGAITGAIQGGKSKTSEEWNNYTNRVTSRIDVTNKSLELVNRNLLALKSTMQTFMMPTSTYFSEKASLEDNFAISAQRGII